MTEDSIPFSVVQFQPFAVFVSSVYFVVHSLLSSFSVSSPPGRRIQHLFP